MRAAEGSVRLRFVVYWRQADWGFYHRRNEALARILATRNTVAEVIHLETVSLKGIVANLVRSVTAQTPGMRAAYRLQVRKALSFRPVRITERLAVQSLVIVAFSTHPMVQRLNRWLFRHQAARLRSNWPTALLAYPPAVHLADLEDVLQPDITLADLVDDVPALETDPARRAAREREFVDILPRCDAAFATSSQLAQCYGRYAPCGIEFLPNGVSISTDSATGQPAERRRYRAAYTGTLNGSLDTELVEYLLEHNPEVDFLLIGPMETAAAPFVRRIHSTFGNCRYLGMRQHDDLQLHLAHCDVLLNLKRADRTTRGNDSIKIYEYLGTGKPVVSTSMAPADRMRDLIHVSDDKVEFSQFLQQALVENDPVLQQRRRMVAAENAWDRRAERILVRIRETALATPAVTAQAGEIPTP